MKKSIYMFGYAGVLLAAICLQSCNDDPIIPNGGGCGNGGDTTWVEDSTDTNGGDGDSTYNGGGTDPGDSTGGWSGGGGDVPGDSTGWNGDSTLIGG